MDKIDTDYKRRATSLKSLGYTFQDVQTTTKPYGSFKGKTKLDQ